MAKILILGAGFGGLHSSSRLAEELGPEHEITLIDKIDHFVIGFTKFDVMFGRRKPDQIKSYYKDLAAERVNFVQDTIELVDTENKSVKTSGGEYSYDYLIIGLGADLAPAATPGFVDGGYHFYSLDGAETLNPVLEKFEGGTIIVSILGKPYKCPPAPYESAFLLNEYFIEKGIRDKVTLKMLIPAAIPLPVAKEPSAKIMENMAAKNIELFIQHKVTGLDPENKQALVDGKDAFDYDLFIGIPLHKPPQVVKNMGMSEGGWIPVNPQNMETKLENVYAVGDVTHIPAGGFAVPKAGAFAQNGADIVVNDILNKLNGTDYDLTFEGSGTCYIEGGDNKVGEIQANFLGGDAPSVKLTEFTLDNRINKEKFESERIEKWFK